MINKYTLLLVVTLFLGTIGLAQTEATDPSAIMARAQQYFDNQQYELALVEYRKLHAQEKSSPVLNYEMAAAHFYLQNYSQSKKFAKAAMKTKSESGVQAAVLLGAIYDELNQPKKSLKVYKRATDDYGDYYLLWYNYGVTANGMGSYNLAAEAFGKAATNRLDHGSSHLALGTVYTQLNRRAEALLSLHFFLLLEPQGDRATMAWNTIEGLWEQGVSQQAGGDIELQLGVDHDINAIPGSEMIISTLQAAHISGMHDGEEAALLPRFQKLVAFVAKADFGDRNDIYTNYYIPFFDRIANSEHYTAFAHYVLQQRSAESARWVVEHTDELEDLFDWLDESSNP